MASYNRVIIMGNLTRDPESKQLTSGQTVCRLGLASNRQFKNRQSGQMVQEVCFVDIDVWGPQAESCSQYLAKGRAVLVEGRLKLDTWQDQNGQNRSKHSIVADRVTFLASSSDETGFGGEQTSASFEQVEPAQKVAKTAKKATPSFDEMSSDDMSLGEVDLKDDKPFDDDLPF